MEQKDGYLVNGNCDAMYLQHMLEKALNELGEICIVDREGCYLYVSDTYAENMNIAMEGAMGKPIQQVIPDSDIPTVLRSGRPTKGVLYQHNGRTFWLNRFPIRENGTIVGVVAQALATDDKTLNHLQTQLNHAMQELNYYKEKYRQSEGAHVTADAIVARSECMMALKENLKTIARTRSTVLITEESGTGKEVISCAIHELSPRRGKPFVRLNCAAIPDNLLEAELFGYEAGAFTGALRGGKMGDFEAANGGTILLDEVDSLTVSMQSKLLRVIQEREIKKVGSTKSTPVDVRFIFATNKDLTALVREGKFREDLYYRINVISLELPPLRERLEDIPLLVEHFIQKFNRELDMDIQGITPEAMALLQSRPWPGNIRELENLVERAFNFAAGPLLEVSDLHIAGAGKSEAKFSASLKDARQKAEKQAILRALHMANGNKKEAASLLEIDRSLLYDKIKLYGITTD